LGLGASVRLEAQGLLQFLDFVLELSVFLRQRFGFLPVLVELLIEFFVVKRIQALCDGFSAVDDGGDAGNIHPAVIFQMHHCGVT